MIEHIWTVLCSRAIVDADSNNLSLINVIEQININDEPKPDGFIPIPFEVVSYWSRIEVDKPANGQVNITLISPSGKLINTNEVPLDLKNFQRERQRVSYPGIPASEPGRYVFHIEFRDESEQQWHEVANVPLTIIFTPHKETQATLFSRNLGSSDAGIQKPCFSG